MNNGRLTAGSGLILALVILAWHTFASAMSAGYPHYSTLFYALLVVAFVAFGGVVVGLYRIMTAR